MLDSLHKIETITRRIERWLPAPVEDSAPAWGADFAYTNAETGRAYRPHHDAEAQAVAEDTPRYMLLRGGEGGGKSVAGIIKTLRRAQRGMSGIVVSPDLPHFKKSLWPEFRRWCPWQFVVEEHRYRARASWEPREAFTLTFVNGATLYMGGMEAPESWEGPNVNFAHFDEARRAKTAGALKVLDGRVRIPGSGGEPPQLWLTTTPRKHWLYEYFGPPIADDPRAAFKSDMRDVVLLTSDNEANLSEGFTARRRQTLTETEARVLLEAAWEDIDEVGRFLPSMLWWDACREALSPLGAREPMVLAADAGVSNDAFAVAGVTRHPDPARRKTDVAVRYCRLWSPPRGGTLDFAAPEAELVRLCRAFNVVMLAYDKYQLHDMMTRLARQRLCRVFDFDQGERRLEADKALYDLIVARRIAHDGDPTLRAHIDNADRKADANDARLRLVKRADALKIDAVVALSMAAYECLRLNL